ncbi:hypothetical protein VTO73DRAFT_3141 [Trametes versicolor]
MERRRRTTPALGARIERAGGGHGAERPTGRPLHAWLRDIIVVLCCAVRSAAAASLLCLELVCSSDARTRNFPSRSPTPPSVLPPPLLRFYK